MLAPQADDSCLLREVYMRYPALLVAAAMVCMALSSSPSIVEPKTGQSFSEQITLPHDPSVAIRCMGVGVRTKAIFKVYAGALYVDEKAVREKLLQYKFASVSALQESQDVYSDIIDAPFSRAIIMKFVRDVDKKRMMETYAEGLSKTLGPIASSPVKDDANRFLAMFDEDIPSGESMALYGDGDTLKVFVRGKEKGTIRNAKLVSAVFSIWLGPNPISADLKRALFSRADWAVK